MSMTPRTLYQYEVSKRIKMSLRKVGKENLYLNKKLYVLLTK